MKHKQQITQLVWAIEYTDCISTEDKTSPMNFQNITPYNLDLWGKRSTFSLPPLPDPLRPGVGAPYRVLSIFFFFFFFFWKPLGRFHLALFSSSVFFYFSILLFLHNFIPRFFFLFNSSLHFSFSNCGVSFRATMFFTYFLVPHPLTPFHSLAPSLSLSLSLFHNLSLIHKLHF